MIVNMLLDGYMSITMILLSVPIQNVKDQVELLYLDIRPAGSNGSGNPRIICRTCKKYKTVSKPYLNPNSSKALDENRVLNERVLF